MTTPARVLTEDQRQAIGETARIVRARRKALGITQIALDLECGFRVRTVQWIEREIPDRRSKVSTDPAVSRTLETLERLEKVQPIALVRPTITRRRGKRQGPAPDPVTLGARLYECPEKSASLTQSACDHLRGADLVCLSLRQGRGCKGVAFRPGLQVKDIRVEYAPPTED